MKKSIIAAGAASVALAAMPIVGAFATVQGSFTDTLNIGVGEICTLTRLVESDNGGHPDGAGAPTSASWTTSGTASDVFAATIVAGQTYNDIAESEFDITCNDVTQGYKVTVATTGSTLPYHAGGYDATDGASSWFISSNGDNQNLVPSSGDPGNIAWQHNATSTVFANDSFTATYNVKADIGLAKGNYSAVAIYTLADVE